MEESRTFTMIIRSLRQHWPARKLEWLMAGFMVTWGWYVLMHPAMFTDEPTATLLAGMVAIASPITSYPALLWGGSAFLVGVMRALALFVNGAYTRTPLIRVIASFVSMFISTQIVIGLWKTGVPNMGLVVYPWFLVADLLSTYRASVDAVHAEKLRQAQKENRRARRNLASLTA